MFTQARLKLTAWYLVIIMAVSMLFSIVIYRVQVKEIERLEFAFRMRSEQRLNVVRPLRPIPMVIQDPEILEEARRRIIMFLVYINAGIIVLSGGLGYVLAGRTLKPISDMLDEQNRFISDASHELRTPLTSLKSAFEVYLRNTKPTLIHAKTLVSESLEETNKLQTLAESLLQLAAYKKPNGLPLKETFEIKEVIDSAIRKVKSKAEKAGIVITADIVPFTFVGNRDSIVQLIVIFLDNAIKYSIKDGAIHISSSKSEKKGTIHVKDTGVGIKKKDLPFIFDRFYRADSSRSKTKIDGFGLGLAIAKQIVKEHNGNIKVDSAVGKGSTFSVTFPLPEHS